MEAKANADYLRLVLKALSQPMPYKWRVQSFNKECTKATCVAYIDARDAMERLDAACEFGWHRRHVELKGRIYCEVGIVMPDGSIQWRMDCGTESNTEGEKGESSDSFKRACVNFGVGRFLYDLDIVTLPASNAGGFKNVVDDAGKKIWNLTDHINGMAKKPQRPAKPSPPPSNLMVGDQEFAALNKALDETKSNKAAFCKYFDIPSVSALPMAKFADAMAMLNEKRKQSAAYYAQMENDHGDFGDRQ